MLGTAAGDGGTHRNKSCVSIQCAGGAILLDAGEPCSQTLQSLGLSREYLRAVFISHTHADHVAGLPALIQDKQVGGRRSVLPLYLPPHLIDPLQIWLDTLAMPKVALSFPLEMHTLKAGWPVVIDDLLISPFATTHDCAGDRASFGFEVRRGKERLVYSSDLGRAEDLLPMLQEPMNYLICEMSHVTPEDLMRVLPACRAEALLLTHIGQQFLEDIHEIRSSLDAALPRIGNVFLPMDGESYPF